eukprot:g4390.t1
MKSFSVGDLVFVVDRENPQEKPPKKATVIELCPDGDIAVRYDPGENSDSDDEEECEAEDLKLRQRGLEGSVVEAKLNASVKKFYVGDLVYVVDRDSPQGKPLKKATVIELCPDGDIAVKYDPGENSDSDDEEECEIKELQLRQRGPEGLAAEGAVEVTKQRKRVIEKRRDTMIDQDDHPAHHSNFIRTDVFYEGDLVSVFDPEHPDAHPHTQWKPATVIEICEDGDIAVRYAKGEEIDGESEEEVGKDEILLRERGEKGKAEEEEEKRKRRAEEEGKAEKAKVRIDVEKKKAEEDALAGKEIDEAANEKEGNARIAKEKQKSEETDTKKKKKINTAAAKKNKAGETIRGEAIDIRKRADAAAKEKMKEETKLKRKAKEEAKTDIATTKTETPIEDASVKEKAEEDALAKTKDEDEALANEKVEEEAAAKRKAEEEETFAKINAKKKNEEEAAAKKKAEDGAEAFRRKAEEDVWEKKIADKEEEEEASPKNTADGEKAVTKRKAEEEDTLTKKKKISHEVQHAQAISKAHLGSHHLFKRKDVKTDKVAGKIEKKEELSKRKEGEGVWVQKRAQGEAAAVEKDIEEKHNLEEATVKITDKNPATKIENVNTVVEDATAAVHDISKLYPKTTTLKLSKNQRRDLEEIQKELISLTHEINGLRAKERKLNDKLFGENFRSHDVTKSQFAWMKKSRPESRMGELFEPNDNYKNSIANATKILKLEKRALGKQMPEELLKTIASGWSTDDKTLDKAFNQIEDFFESVNTNGKQNSTQKCQSKGMSPLEKMRLRLHHRGITTSQLWTMMEPDEVDNVQYFGFCNGLRISGLRMSAEQLQELWRVFQTTELQSDLGVSDGARKVSWRFFKQLVDLETLRNIDNETVLLRSSRDVLASTPRKRPVTAEMFISFNNSPHRTTTSRSRRAQSSRVRYRARSRRQVSTSRSKRASSRRLLGHAKRRFDIARISQDLYDAISADHNGHVIEILQSDLAKKLKITCNSGLDAMGRTAMHVAAYSGSYNCAVLIHSLGGSVLMTDANESQPIIASASRGYLKLCKFFVEKGARIDCVDGQGRTPLHLASGNGHLQICKWILGRAKKEYQRNWARYLWKGDAQEATPLHYAAASGHLEIVEWIADVADIAGAEPLALLLACKEDGMNAQDVARRFGHSKLAAWLDERISKLEIDEDNELDELDLLQKTSIFTSQSHFYGNGGREMRKPEKKIMIGPFEKQMSTRKKSKSTRRRTISKKREKLLKMEATNKRIKDRARMKNTKKFLNLTLNVKLQAHK